MTKHLASPASVVKVGDGRGFIIDYRTKFKVTPLEQRLKLRRRFLTSEQRLVVTAAHCLPNLPPAIAAGTPGRTYKDLLSSLDGSKTGVWAECLFADPIADIAVLCCPDEQQLDEQADAYHALTDEVPAVRIGKPRNGRGWVLALSGSRWLQTTLEVLSGWWGTHLNITGPNEAGMSGSPILNDAGRAVGLIAIGCETVSGGVRQREKSGPQPILARDLPSRLVSWSKPGSKC